jgi:hypothetical protein
MTEVKVTTQTVPDPRRDSYFRIFLSLLEAQKHICLNECATTGDQHVRACMELNLALSEAESVLDSWQQ